MRIGLVGTYDVENYGDCYFPELWAHKLKEMDADVDVTLFSPTDRAADILSYDRIRALPGTLDAPLRHAGGKPFDALVLTGGETIGAGHNSGTYIYPAKTFSHYLRLWLSPVLEAARSRASATQTRFVAHAVGVAPLSAEVDAMVGAALAGADYVSLRDTYSAERLSARLDSNPFGVAADPMFMLNDLDTPDGWRARAQKLLPQGFAPQGYIAAQVSYGYFAQDFQTWVDAIAGISRTHSKPVLLVPVCHFLHDEILLEVARERLKAQGITVGIVRGRVNVKDTAAVLGQAAAVVCSSLHAAVTAVVFGVPLAVLAHSMTGKHQGTLETIGIDRAVTTQAAGLPDILTHTLTLDFTAAAARGRAQAEADLAGVMAMIKGGPLPHTPPEVSRIEAAAGTLSDYEARTILADRKDTLKRAVFSTMRKIPGAQEAYERFKVSRRIRNI